MEAILQRIAQSATVSTWNTNGVKKDRETKIKIYKCDICNYDIKNAPDNLEYQMKMLDDLDDSFESEYDKHEPRLLLCDYCTKEYQIPGYPMH